MKAVRDRNASRPYSATNTKAAFDTTFQKFGTPAIVRPSAKE